MNTQPRILAQEVSYTYEEAETPALQKVSAAIAPGEFVAVLGHNGSGKSTFAKLLNALYIPTEGRLLVCGLDTQEEDKVWDVRQHAGMIFQNPDNQLVATVVREDVAFGLENLGVPTDEMVRRIDAALEAVHMTEFAASAPHLLSGGQKQRVAIAGVLAMDPKVLILDEPTAGLDPRGRDTILGEIREYHEERKNTVLLVSHSMEDIAQYAKKVLVIAEGKPAMYDTVENIFSRVEELTAMGLAVPQISRVFAGLRAAGYQVPGNIYTVEGAAAAILNAVKGGAAR